MKADQRSNQVIVQTLPARMLQIEELISQLDRKTKEVFIDAKIIKIKLTDNRTESVKWEGLFDLDDEDGMHYLGSYPFSAVQATSDVWRSRTEVLADVGNVGSYPFSGTSTNYAASGSVTAA